MTLKKMGSETSEHKEFWDRLNSPESQKRFAEWKARQELERQRLVALYPAVERDAPQAALPLAPRPSLLRQPFLLFPCRPKCYHSTMIDWSSCSDVERDPDRVSGAWVFRGTRVPVAALFENLEEDASVHQFIEWFPGVSLSQARHVLEHAARSTLLAA